MANPCSLLDTPILQSSSPGFLPHPSLRFPKPSTSYPLARSTRRRRTTCSLPGAATDALTAAGRLLWGRSLPPQALVSVARTAWSTVWLLMMRQLAPSSAGSYTRHQSPFPSVPASYNRRVPTPRLHLYVGLPCPWAHRTLIVRALKGLEQQIPVSVAAPGADGAWEFADAVGTDREEKGLLPGPDRANGRRTLREVYKLKRGGYDGRSTVPMLWDADKNEVVCNESYGIIEFFNSGFADTESSGNEMDLAPPEHKDKIEEWNREIYPKVNNGVYRCGFAQSQVAYDVAAKELFNTLDRIDAHLETSRYLCGSVLTLADVCLFTTLIRFDLVYNVLFKCTKKKLIEYSNLHAYMRDIYQIPKIAATCNFEAMLDGYYRILFPLNPGSICPVMPLVCQPECLNEPHGRESISLAVQAMS